MEFIDGLAGVWSAAQPLAAHDPAAADATRRAEGRLDELAPELMARYRALLDAGTEPAQAMHTAANTLGAAAACGPRRARNGPRPSPPPPPRIFPPPASTSTTRAPPTVLATPR